MARYSTPITQYLDDAGNPLVGGKLTFYASGTENLQNTYNTEGCIRLMTFLYGRLIHTLQPQRRQDSMSGPRR